MVVACALLAPQRAAAQTSEVRVLASNGIKAVVDTKFDKTDPNIFKVKAFVDKVDEIWNLVRIEAIKAQGGRAP